MKNQTPLKFFKAEEAARLRLSPRKMEDRIKEFDRHYPHLKLVRKNARVIFVEAK